MAERDRERTGGKSAAQVRAERLEAELRANLKKRKELAKARAGKASPPPCGVDDKSEA
jgi:hypothetical protein